MAGEPSEMYLNSKQTIRDTYCHVQSISGMRILYENEPRRASYRPAWSDKKRNVCSIHAIPSGESQMAVIWLAYKLLKKLIIK